MPMRGSWRSALQQAEVPLKGNWQIYSFKPLQSRVSFWINPFLIPDLRYNLMTESLAATAPLFDSNSFGLPCHISKFKISPSQQFHPCRRAEGSLDFQANLPEKSLGDTTTLSWHYIDRCKVISISFSLVSVGRIHPHSLITLAPPNIASDSHLS